MTTPDWISLSLVAVSLIINVWQWFENRRLDREIHDRWMEYWRK